VVTSLFSASPVLAALVGGAAGGGLFLLVVALRGLPSKRAPQAILGRQVRQLAGPRGAAALITGVLVLILTRWVAGAIGVALLVLSWRTLSGAAAERRTMARLAALATWTESLRDTIAGAVGLEQAIPASLGPPRRRCAIRWAGWSTGCTPGCQWPRRCASSPTTWTPRAPI
jgi:hypothetical protein